MKTFHCPVCTADVFFDSTTCEACQSNLLFNPLNDAFVAVGVACANSGTRTRCNWLSSSSGQFCAACQLDTRQDNQPYEVPFQEAKRRTLRQFYNFGGRTDGIAPQLQFDLRSSTYNEQVITGHANGLITIDTAEGDPVQLAETQAHLGEPYRTPLGHIRHELGHWFWATAIENAFSSQSFRTQFGDERNNYTEALQAHYAQPDLGQWTGFFLSHYASAHPWEDFAESFAHVLHMDDTLETAATHGLISLPTGSDFDSYYSVWVDFAMALNDLNRSMGTPDPYPFVVPPPAVDKLRFVYRSLKGLRGSGAG